MSERVTFVEIDLPVCERRYGVAPCAAALGETGDKKCFNTRKTCQDIENYSEVTDVLRLAKPSAFLPLGITAVANIKSVQYTPSILALGESIGARSTLTVTCGDHPFPDNGPGGDLYRESRPYADPFHQGTFWGKIKARQPYLRGRVLRWYTGRASDNLDQMERRTFVIDRVEGPSTNGQFTIVAKDPLTLTDDKRAQAPVLSRGVLRDPIDETQTSFTLAPFGIGDEEYPAAGKIAIGGNEVCSFTRSGDALTVTRGINGTEAQEHDEDDRVQLILEYEAADPADIIFDLLTTYGNIPAQYINLANWRAETSDFLGRAYTGMVAEPLAVDKLINELLQQTAMTIWWDEFGDQIRLQVLRDITQGTFLYNDDFVIGGSFAQKDQPEKRVSQVWTYYGQINPLESQDDPKNYRNSLRTVNLLSERNHGSAAIRSIYSRWITQFGRTSVERLNNLIIGRYAEPPKLYTMELLRDSGTPLPSLGSGARLESFFNQDDEGYAVHSRVQFVQAKATDASLTLQAEEVVIAEGVEPDDPTAKVLPIDNDINNFNFRTAYLQEFAEANEGDTVICQIRGGVVVGSNSTSSPAWDSGDGWPSGVTLLLELFGDATISGRPGTGGRGGDAKLDAASPYGYARNGAQGAAGGLSLKARVPITVQNNGAIQGGGGGGGGGGGLASWGESFDISTSFRGIIGGSGGGSGAGMIAQSAGGGGRDLDSGGFGTSVDFRSEGRAGQQGGLSAGGAGGANYAPNTFERFNEFESGAGGAGGGPGQPGLPGGPSLSDPLSTARETSTDWIGGFVANGGPGGAAGAAIEGDSLITFTNEGTILGARIN